MEDSLATSRKSRSQARAAGGPIAAAGPATAAGAVHRDAIAKRAYELWQARGCPHGQREEHWYEAERELQARLAP